MKCMSKRQYESIGIYIFYKWISRETLLKSDLVRVRDLIRSITTTSIVASMRAHLRGERGRMKELRMKATPLKPRPQKFNLISRRCAFDPPRLNICKA